MTNQMPSKTDPTRLPGEANDGAPAGRIIRVPSNASDLEARLAVSDLILAIKNSDPTSPPVDARANIGGDEVATAIRFLLEG